MTKTVTEIVQELSRWSSTFPEEALNSARKNWPELLPEITNLFDHIIQRNPITEKQESFLFWSILLVGDQGEKACFEQLMALLEHDKENGLILDRVLGYTITETMPAILYLLGEHHPDRMSRVVSASGTDEYIKSGIMSVLFSMVQDGKLSSDFFAAHAPIWLASMTSCDDAFAAACLGGYLIHFEIVSYQKEFLALEKEGKIDPSMLTLEEIQDWQLSYPLDRKECVTPTFDIMSIKDWACFRKNEWSIEKPFVKSLAPKRNDPCFCGSGKKYKKCCLT